MMSDQVLGRDKLFECHNQKEEERNTAKEMFRKEEKEKSNAC